MPFTALPFIFSSAKMISYVMGRSAEPRGSPVSASFVSLGKLISLSVSDFSYL